MHANKNIFKDAETHRHMQARNLGFWKNKNKWKLKSYLDESQWVGIVVSKSYGPWRVTGSEPGRRESYQHPHVRCLQTTPVCPKIILQLFPFPERPAAATTNNREPEFSEFVQPSKRFSRMCAFRQIMDVTRTLFSNNLKAKIDAYFLLG